MRYENEVTLLIMLVVAGIVPWFFVLKPFGHVAQIAGLAVQFVACVAMICRVRSLAKK